MNRRVERREFLKGTAWMGAVALAAGRVAAAERLATAPTMAGFAAPPMARIRLAFIGIGERGTAAVRRVSKIPGCDIVALCDLRREAVNKNLKWLKENGGGLGDDRPAGTYFGSSDCWKGACDDPGVDVVYVAVPAYLHARIALYAMNAGKHVLVEVPAANTIDDCWNIVETSERTRRHCMMLENCCYGEHEMLALNMCRLGVLGETVYGEAGYLHSGKTRGFKLSGFRAEWYQEHRGNYYPTHGLGPVAQYMNINRGDRFEYLNSMESTSIGDLIRAGDTRWNGENLEAYRKYLIGGYSSSLIHTVNGKIILLNLSCQVPHPYSRINTIQGTHGIFMDYPLRIDVEDEPGSGPHEKRDLEFNDRFDHARTAAYREKYRHPLWKQAGELAKKSGGHGGMDFLMDLRWVYCLQNGLPLDMDVYDLAAWSCLCEITEKSQARRGAPIDIPDFTRGAWKTMKPLGIVTVDIAKMGTFPA